MENHRYDGSVNLSEINGESIENEIDTETTSSTQGSSDTSKSLIDENKMKNINYYREYMFVLIPTYSVFQNKRGWSGKRS